MKGVFANKFPNHHLFAANVPDWFQDMHQRFLKEADRCRIDDPAVAEGRKSEPIYRDLSENRTGVRAKFSDDLEVDAKSIATSMIRNIKSAGILLEFDLCRSVRGPFNRGERGGRRPT